MMLYTYEQDQTPTGQRFHSDNLLTAVKFHWENPAYMATAMTLMLLH
jgi:hypothetical protein